MRKLLCLLALAAMTAATVLVPLSCKGDPQSLDGLLATCGDRLPGWRLTRASPIELYLHREPAEVGDLQALPSLPQHLHRWRGVVRISAAHDSPRALHVWLGDQLKRWHKYECCHTSGRFLLWGDPEAIRALRD